MKERRFAYHLCPAIAWCLILASATVAKLPSELPGDEITEDDYFDFVFPRDSIAQQVPDNSPSSPTWLDSAANTWDAPELSVQMSEDQEKLLMGMGAVFIPRMSDADNEPDVEILDGNGEVVARGKPGRKYSLVPGQYYIMLGSGSHKQRVVKKVDVTEGKATPLVPDWAALQIDVVDENNVPFRGEYEMVRIDDFEPLGRGYGKNPDLGEQLRTWILRPGTYKILGVGESYNTLTNFVTVRLLPGELVRFLLVQDEEDMTLLGGGLINTEVDRQLASNWRYGLDIGGTVDFNAIKDRLDTSKTQTQVTLSLLSRTRLKYEKEPFEWENRLTIDEGVDYIRKTSRLESKVDDVLLRSLFTWRVLRWLGPYGRAELETEFIPMYERRPANKDKYFFILLNPDSSLASIDSVKESYLLQPAFSPFSFNAGAGFNANVVNTRYFESRLLLGFGFKQETQWKTMQAVDTSAIDTADRIQGPIRRIIDTHNADDYATLVDWGTTVTRPEFGPELALNTLLRIGRWATAESELELFTPVQRLEAEKYRPDVRWRATLSWRIVGSVTADYQYEYRLRWPEEEELHSNESRHRVLLRFSLTSR